MCIASKRLNELNKVLNGIKEDTMKLRQKVSEYDKSLSNLYHKIEMANFNAAEGYYLAKEMQILLQKRRIVKDEVHRMEYLFKCVSDGALHNKLKQTSNKIDKARKRSKEWKQGFKIDMDTFELEMLH